jgi:tetratricopeptide (TPR) repeat protein
VRDPSWRIAISALKVLTGCLIIAALQLSIPESVESSQKKNDGNPVSSASVAAEQRVASADAILVLDAFVTPDNSLTITGRNFGTATPVVSLDGNVLTVSSLSSTKIIADLPALLAAGSHMLLVSASSESQEFAAFNVRIGPARTNEPKGPGPEELRVAGLEAFSRGYLVQAHSLLDRAMALAVQEHDTYLVALIHDGLGGIYQNEFEFLKAERELVQGVDILRRQPEHAHALAMSLANLGAALSGQHRNPEATRVLSEASKLIKDYAINDPKLQTHILDVLAGVRLQLGQSKQAEVLFLRALRENPSPDNTIAPIVADILNNLGTLYARNGKYGKAVASYTRALQLTEQQFGQSHPNLATSLENLGFAYIRMRRFNDAEPQFLRSVAILEDRGLLKSNMGLFALYGLGFTYMEKNELERAEPLLARAVETGRTIAARTPEMVQAIEVYSSLLSRLSRPSDAQNLRNEAARLRSELAFTTRVGP